MQHSSCCTSKKGFREEKKEKEILIMSDIKRARTKEWERCFCGKEKTENHERSFSLVAEKGEDDSKVVEIKVDLGSG